MYATQSSSGDVVLVFMFSFSETADGINLHFTTDDSLYNGVCDE